jgi:hypothetical protein
VALGSTGFGVAGCAWLVGLGGCRGCFESLISSAPVASAPAHFWVLGPSIVDAVLPMLLDQLASALGLVPAPGPSAAGLIVASMIGSACRPPVSLRRCPLLVPFNQRLFDTARFYRGLGVDLWRRLRRLRTLILRRLHGWFVSLRDRIGRHGDHFLRGGLPSLTTSRGSAVGFGLTGAGCCCWVLG